MKEELLKQFTARLIHYVDSAEMFLKGNVPDYIEQLLKYEMYHQISILTIGFVMLALLGIVILFLYRKVYLNGKTSEDADVSFWFLSVMLFFLWIVWFATQGLCSINRIVKINVAPKVYIVEYLRKNK